MKLKIVTCVGAILFLTWTAVGLDAAERFNEQCGDHILRAAQSETIETAQQELRLAVWYLEQKGFDSEDFYLNLVGLLAQLEKIKGQATESQKTDLLLKLRALLQVYPAHRVSQIPVGSHYVSESVGVSLPLGISVHPYETLFFVWGLTAGALMLVGGVWLFIRGVRKW